MVSTGVERRECVIRGLRIAKRCKRVAQPPLVTDAPDRTAGELLVEFLEAPGEQADKPRCVQIIARREVRIADLGEAVPRAAKLAIVAPVNAIADGWRRNGTNGPLKLDRQIRNAKPRIDLVRRDDRRGRATGDAAGAVPAMVHGWRVRRQGKRRVDFPEEVPGTGARQRNRMLSAPGDAGVMRNSTSITGAESESES